MLAVYGGCTMTDGPKVKWHAASALEPESYKSLLDNKTAVVHTLGMLLEGGYKDAVKNNQAMGLLSSLANNFSSSRNPLASKEGGEYELINRDAGGPRLRYAGIWIHGPCSTRGCSGLSHVYSCPGCFANFRLRLRGGYIPTLDSESIY